ncbi:MAG: lysine--tRNA ligase [Sulfurospirillaceae bacterium]|nr:lysine--tRNA ligase [Sulfurospirillaceae bacterium]MDD2827302.1 lysine--tRNA ligase [Sulfurospirillaceae bacterium]
MFDDQYQQQRIEKGHALKALGRNPYRHNITKDTSTKEFLECYDYVIQSEEKRDEHKNNTVVGRIKFLRHMGKAAFAKIEDEHGILQIYFSRESIGEEWFAEAKKLVEVGDIISVTGFPFVTKTGELSLHAKVLEIATKSIIPLPEKFHGLQDKELRYRKRYLDMIMNADVRRTFKIRSKIVSEIRHFFEERNFLEVETPMMHPIAGGANAKPFVTHHNALDVDRYLRIAPELYLKRLVVGGFEAVFEINRNFRNEGMDQTHNPEFTMIEFYWAYHNYNDLMHLTEEMFDVLLKKLKLPKKLPYGDMEIDFSKPFRKIGFREALCNIGEVPNEILDDCAQIVAYIKTKGFEVDAKLNLGKLYEELFDLFVEEKLINPTFIMDYPIEISPLARRSEENPSIAERFELFIAGREIANGFNELNDPIDQYERFAKQLQAKNAGDDEAHEMDEDYVQALGYGLPPTAGQGLGIDRLTMLLTNEESIKDVILFPAMKPLTENDELLQKDEE